MITKLLITGLVLFSFSAQSMDFNPLDTIENCGFSQATPTEKKENSVQKNILFKLVEQTITAYRYWENYQLTAKTKLLDISIDKKQFFLQDADVELKKEALLLIQKKLAHAIDRVSTSKEFAPDLFSTFTEKVISDLAKCDIPSIIKRNWLGCTVGAIGIGYAAYLYKKSLEPSDFSMKQIESPFSEFYTSFFKKPFQNLQELLLVELPKQKLVGLDLETAIAHQQEAKLNLVTQAYTAYLNGDKTFESIFKTIEINALTNKQIDIIINNMNGTNSFLRIAVDILDNGFHKAWSLIGLQKKIPLVPTPTYNLDSICYQKNDLKFNIATFGQILTKINFGKQLTTESLKLSLSVGSLFAAKKATYHCLGWTYEQAVIEPLIADLNDYNYFLQTQKINYCSDNAYFNGMNIYWTAKLTQYTSKINSVHRVEFNRKMTLLASPNITLKNRIKIVQLILDSQCLR